MKKTNKTLFCFIALLIVLCNILTATVSAAQRNTLGKDIKDAAETAGEIVSDAAETAKDAVSGAIEDITDAAEDMLDPEKGEAGKNEENGLIGDTTNEMPAQDNNDESGAGDTQGESLPNEAETRDESVADNSNDAERSINPWAVVIAVVAVIAILILIFLLIPKRR